MEMSWKTTTRSLTLRFFHLNSTEKVPSMTARLQRPSCSIKHPQSLFQRVEAALNIKNLVDSGESKIDLAEVVETEV